MRFHRVTIPILCPILVLVACAPPSDVPPVPALPPENACGAAQYQSLVGTAVNAALFDSHDSLRIIPPGVAVTMDYSPTRLNVETDTAGRITRIYCG